MPSCVPVTHLRGSITTSSGERCEGKARGKVRELLNLLFWGALQRTRWVLVMRHLQLEHCSSHCAQVCLQGTFSPLPWISPQESKRTSLFSLQPTDLSCLSKFLVVSELNIFLFFSHPRWDKVSALESAKVRGDSLTGCSLDFSQPWFHLRRVDTSGHGERGMVGDFVCISF